MGLACSLLLDCDDSPDFPGHTGIVLGRPLAAYPLFATTSCRKISRHYAVTKNDPVKSSARQNGAVVIDPPEPASGALIDSFVRHGWKFIADDTRGEVVDAVVVLLANAPMAGLDDIETALSALMERPEADSVVTASRQNRFHPHCARRLTPEGFLEPYAAAAEGSGDVYYPNWGVAALRPRILSAAFAPWSWLGRKVLALRRSGEGPVDYRWQLPAVESWLKDRGATDASFMPRAQPQKKPQTRPAPSATDADGDN